MRVPPVPSTLTLALRRAARRLSATTLVVAMTTLSASTAQAEGSAPARRPERDGSARAAPSPPQRPNQTPSVTVPVEPTPVVLEGLGLSINPPAGAVVARERTGDAVNLVMADQAENPRWRLRIQALNASADTPTSRAIVQDHLTRIRGTGEPHEILALEPAQWGGAAGDLLVVEQRSADGQPVINGWLVLGRGGLLHTTFTLSTTRADLPAARAALESSLATLVFTDIDALIQERRERLKAGERFIETLAPERLRSLLGLNEWFRLHRPGGGSGPMDDQELGYVHFQVVEAMQGELEPQRPTDELRGDEAEQGLMLIAKARGLLRNDGSELLDIEARYWMAWDRGAEAWSSRTTERKGRSLRSFAQTGVRPRVRPSQTSTLTVLSVRSDLGKDPYKPSQSWDLPPRGYLSVPEAMLLGWLLPRDANPPPRSDQGPELRPELKPEPKPEPKPELKPERSPDLQQAVTPEPQPEVNYAFCAFDAKEGSLPLRLDDWIPSPEGLWTLVSRPGPDEPATRQTFDARGHRLRLLDADGVHSDRIELAELHRIWSAKGLPTGGPR